MTRLPVEKPVEQPTTKPHVHAELIKAWADGAEIEYRAAAGLWVSLTSYSWAPSCVYRIKPTVVEPIKPKGPTLQDLINAQKNSDAKYQSRRDKLKSLRKAIDTQIHAVAIQYDKKAAQNLSMREGL